RVAENRHGVLEVDCATRLACARLTLVQHELVDLAAALAAITAEIVDNPGARFGTRPQSGGLERLVEQIAQHGLDVRIAGYRRHERRGFGEPAQLRGWPQVAGLDHRERVAGL